MMQRFRDWEAKGKIPVLLYAGDCDPGASHISAKLMSNMVDIERAVGWNPESVVIERFGLNLDFIEANGLSRMGISLGIPVPA